MPSTYRHSLRRHVPSRPIQTSPPPPDSPKSDAASLSLHRSKRERAKEAVEHFFDKLHIHHHHHHRHDQPLDDKLAPSPIIATSPSSAYGSKAPSLSDKENLIAFEVPPLHYDSLSAASSSEHVHAVKVAPDEQPTLQTNVPAASDYPVSSRDIASSDSFDDTRSAHPSREIILGDSTLLGTATSSSIEPFAGESSQEETIPALDPDDSLDSSLEASDLVASSPVDADPRPLSVDMDSSSIPMITITEVVPESMNDLKDSVHVQASACATTSPELSRTQSIDDDCGAENSDIVVVTVGDTELSSDRLSLSLLNKVMVDTPCQTDEGDTLSLHEVEHYPLVAAQAQAPAVTDCALEPSPTKTSAALITPSHSAGSKPARIPQLSYAKIPYTHTEPIVPLYSELRKLANNRPTKKPSWISYIYRSFVKPAVSVARECTAAAIQYGVSRILDARPPALREATSWLV